MSRCALIVCCCCAAFAAHAAHGQTPARSRRAPQPSNAPNVTGESDAAASELVDSLFSPFAPADPLPGVATRAMGVPETKAQRPKWSARLARNPHAEDGNPPFVLIDRYGGVQRYVEPTANVDLDRYVGQTVAVRRDSGGNLLASQLELPRTPVRRAMSAMGATQAGGARVAFTAPKSGVRQASQVESVRPLTPTPADDGPPAVGDQLPAPMPMSESVNGEIVEQGPMMSESYHSGDGQMYEGMEIPEGVDPLYLDGQSEMGSGHCALCGDAVCGGTGCLGGCGFGSRPVFWASGEYLAWQFKGMDIPPLVVRGEVNDNGTTGDPTDDFFDNAVVVYGGNQVLDQVRSGARVTLGYYFDDYGKWGIQGDYITFGKVTDHFEDGGDGISPIVGRPFIDATTGLPAVEDVSFPGIAGTVSVDIDSRFQSAGIAFRRNLCCVAGCSTGCGDAVGCGSTVGCGSCASCNGYEGGKGACPVCPLLATKLGRWFSGGTRHVDVLYGVRWAELKEGLRINEDLIADDDTTFLIDDVFNTQNQFIGGEIGFAVDWQKRRWSLEMLSKLAIGNTRQQVNIHGQTLRDDQLYDGIGLLAQPSNSGTFSRDEFSVLPQIGLTAGYMLTERLRFTVGYTLLYWSRVARPGDQIDLRVNPEWLDLAATPGQQPDPSTIQPQSPEFVFRDADIWAQGVNAGLDYRW